MINLFNQCPACGGHIIVTECKCTRCQLQMRGEFLPGRFSTLSEDQLTFIRVFLKARGNLTEMERILGISYPTIRNKLEEVNNTLETLEDSTPPSDLNSAAVAINNSEEESRKNILQKVADGHFSAAEALEKLRALGGVKK
jgi:hypothetical protein